MIVVIMGVSGSGKTTIGSLLANSLGWKFYDADDFHSQDNRDKMSQGIPLTDQDRSTWLASLRKLIQESINSTTSLVLACSALKEAYRSRLNVDGQVKFVYLKGTYSKIESRLKNRTGHFMPIKLLKSQFEALEEPVDALAIDINHSTEEIIQLILKGLAI